MGMIADLFVKLGLKSDEFNRGLDSAKQKTSMFSGAVAKIGGAIAGAFAVSAIWSFVKNAVNGYNEIAQANAKMNAVLKSTGGQAGVTAAQIKALSSELSGSTLFSGTALTNASALLLTFTKVGRDVFPEAMRAAANMSTVFGTDLQGSIIQVGKALNSPNIGITALRRSGVSFTDEQVSMIKTLTATGRLLDAQKIILSELKTEFDGAAQAASRAGTAGFVMLGKQVKAFSKWLGEAIVESRTFKIAIDALGYSLVNLKKFFDVTDKAKTIDVEIGVDSIIKDLPTNVEEAKKVIDKNIEELRGYAADYAASIARESSGVLNKMQLLNPLSGQSRKIDGLKKQADLYLQQIAALEKHRANLKPPIEKKDLTFTQQYVAAIADLKNDIREAEEAAKQADPGKPFVEASKAVADAKKALVDFIETYKKLPERGGNLAPLTGGKGVKFGTPKESLPSTTIGANGLFTDMSSQDAAIAAGAGLDMKGITSSLAANKEQLKTALSEFISPVQEFNNELNDLINKGLNDAAMSFGEGIGALMAGDINIGEFGLGLLGVVGQFMVQFGQLIIAYAIAAAGLEAAIKTPGAWPIALAAGIALVAVGSAISSLSSKGISGGGGSGGGGSYAAASGYSGSSGMSSASNMLEGKVAFELQGTVIKGVLYNVDRKNKNIR